MADETTPVQISDQTVLFVDRGKTTVRWIDLFDEARHGADKLFFRGRFATFADVAAQIEAALSDDFKDTHGSGNPLEKDAQSGIAMNRYDVPEKKHWVSPHPSDPYPNKARFAVQFMLRIRTWTDFAYVTVGLPWNKLVVADNGTVNEDYPIDESFVTGGVKVEDLKVVECHNISVRDAAKVAAQLGCSENEDEMVSVSASDFEFISQLKSPNEDGEIFSVVQTEESTQGVTNMEALVPENEENGAIDAEN